MKRIKYFHEYSDVLKSTPIESFKKGKPKVPANHREECYWSGKTGGSCKYNANVPSCAPEVRTCGRTRPVEEGTLKNNMDKVPESYHGDNCEQAVKRIKYHHEHSDVLNHNRKPVGKGMSKVSLNHFQEECYWSGKAEGSRRYIAVGNVLSYAPEIRTCGRRQPVEEGSLKPESCHGGNSKHAVERIEYHHDVLNHKRKPIRSFGKGMSKVSLNHFQEECYWSGKAEGSRGYKAVGDALSYAPEIRTCGDNSKHAVERMEYHHDVLNHKPGPIESFGKGMSKVSLNHFQEEGHCSRKTGGSHRYKATGDVLSCAPEVCTRGRFLQSIEECVLTILVEQDPEDCQGLHSRRFTCTNYHVHGDALKRSHIPVLRRGRFGAHELQLPKCIHTFHCYRITRLYSSGSHMPDVCYMIGYEGKFTVPGNKFESFEDFLKENPFLTLIPKHRIFGPRGKRPYMLVDRIRVLIRSGSITLYMAELNQMKIANPFFKDNVVVHKELGFMAFKKLDLELGMTELNPSAHYHQYVNYLKVTISETHGLQSLDKLPLELDGYLMDLSSSKVDGKSAVYHANLMVDDAYAYMCFSVYRILCKQVSLCKDKRSVQIKRAIGREHMYALEISLQHGLLPQFLPKKLQKKFPALEFPFTSQLPLSPSDKPTEEESGDIVTQSHRHALAHFAELPASEVVTKNFKSFRGRVRFHDIMMILRNKHPKYLHNAFLAFQWFKRDHLLRIEIQFPIDNFYRQSPRTPPK